MAASVFAFYRDNLIVDNLLSFLMSDQTKERFIALVWEPPKFLLAVSGVLLLMLVSVSVLVRFVSAVVRTPVNFYHTFSVTMWAMLPAVVLIPLVTILYRLMESQFYVVPVFFIVGLVTAWMIARLFKGISIVFDVFPLKVYAVGFLLMIGCGAACYGYLDYAHSTSFYLKNVGHLVGLVGRAL
jgi:hypothetical protein